MQIQETLRNNCPNIKFLRSLVSKWRIEKLKKHLMPEADILEALHSLEQRKQIVEKYNYLWPGYYHAAEKKINSLFETAPAYQERADLDIVRTNMLFYRYAFGFLPEEYLCFELEKRNIEETRNFVSDIERIWYDCQMSDMADSKIFKDKMQTYEKFKPYYHRDAISIEKPADLTKFQKFIKAHPVFVKKAVFESCGKSIELINIDELKESSEDFFYSLVKSGKYILEDKINQSGKMGILNESSVNTIRCMTFNTRHGIKIPYCFLKVGKKGAFVDNAGAGGIVSGIDCETGIVGTNGIDEFGEHYLYHPDSKIVFKGFQIPEWDDMKKICETLAIKTPTVGFIGWDLAHTDNGWVLVEGNNCGQLIIPQMTWQRGIKSEVLEIMSDMKLLA